ncbi:hypothetical protein NDU88_006246 [Pleurodeles waltl]|uniref:Uncharacterized protein n=1 Tax=Pleurodeles waltl TaxID=8319 RepID=A0AAV7VNM4_PLEWA|nr:hypothetical protein NDU88_006246 [Pleurodeles waltl]
MRSRSRSNGPKKAAKDRHSRSGGLPVSPPQHCPSGRWETEGTVKPDPVEEQQGPWRRRIGPKRGEEKRRSGSGLAASAPSKKQLPRGTRDRCQDRPRRERLTETEH